MGNLVNLVRKMVQEELSEMARPLFLIKVIDAEKAERAKKLHSGHWVSDMIKLIINSGEEGITRKFNKETGKKGLAELLNKAPESLNVEIRALQDNGIISRDSLTPIKPEKEPGQKGRKVDPKSYRNVYNTLIQKFTNDPNYKPTDDDITFRLQKGYGDAKLSDIDIIKAKRLASRGSTQESLYEIYKRLQDIK